MDVRQTLGIVARFGRFTSTDVHRALFPKRASQNRTLEDMKEGIRRRARERYARYEHLTK